MLRVYPHGKPLAYGLRGGPVSGLNEKRILIVDDDDATAGSGGRHSLGPVGGDVRQLIAHVRECLAIA